ncbi:ABC transporter ATP-binding protein [Glaciibacter psychrotolerans]|uniref:Peptide/nickel transport system ATP-binding protein n=1 Tax=Glaciibacter psychrotolerans TaxID=670054 RepID=A0A7Z0EHR1_9MICO|nr:ATP-binding cassette domain-containing protein [Leifsonia psychrotolerans]NYJ21074.1 peptide/nickel transport system ATP-binding protein [Leifsonia psychrotolerans]
MTENDMLIEVRDLRKVFRRGGRDIVAVHGASFSMASGRNLGIVGESGSGKSTIARMLMGVEKATAGTVSVCGEDMTIPARSAAARRRRAKLTQMVYQDPFGSLDSRQTVASCLREVLRIHGVTAAAAREARIAELCDLVGLSAVQRERTPRDLSGGQRQRVAIARALAVQPEIIVLDEAVAALDISIQAQILNLLADVQRETGTNYVLISHDLAVVGHLTDDVVVMRHGRIVEQGVTAEVLGNPTDEYTRILRDSVPSLDWRQPGVLEAVAERVGPRTNFATRNISVPSTLERTR